MTEWERFQDILEEFYEGQVARIIALRRATNLPIELCCLIVGWEEHPWIDPYQEMMFYMKWF